MIHTIKAYGQSNGHRTPKEERVFGYFETRAEARSAVLHNDMNMHECLYTHLVIEAVPPGVHGLAQDEEWFVWLRGCEWFPCARPEWAEGVCNHAMG